MIGNTRYIRRRESVQDIKPQTGEGGTSLGGGLVNAVTIPT